MEWTIGRAADPAVEAIEDEYHAYIHEHMGPLWGHADEEALAAIMDRLRAVYAAKAVDDFDRIAL